MAVTAPADRTHVLRLELADEPGALLAALAPIADAGGNLLSVLHERGSVTPRGRIPVEVTVECQPDRFETVVGALEDAGVTVIDATAERYADAVTVLLVGDLVATDLSELLASVEECEAASVVEFALTDEPGVDHEASARLRMGVADGAAERALAAVRAVAAEAGVRVIEPLAGDRR
ncbi:amino acid-binding protein [Halobacterium salinarum]|uniref:ACT domain-containing protein n=1 Tax=Halobacterium salinarum (strain ATCC 33171 / DSM 3754 / JCM 8978 / NBRC 102687 / NCIMB 764 / 91-R6) TaxID=2597657 RepID=A0A663ABW6_HALS9|nr:ACT domain-containing protein [Halobacterium salinarum DSM 3754]